MFIALEDCLVDYDCHVEFGGIMLGLLVPADGGAALFRNVNTAQHPGIHESSLHRYANL